MRRLLVSAALALLVSPAFAQAKKPIALRDMDDPSLRALDEFFRQAATLIGPAK